MRLNIVGPHDSRLPVHAPPLVAHLVGSVPLADAAAVFRKLGPELGPYLRRLLDGETGRRADWIGFVRRNLGRNPAFEKDTDVASFQFKQWDGKVVMEWPLLRFASGADRKAVSFTTGYASDAIAYHAVYARARADGIIPAHIKFQICAATPHAISYMYVTPRDQADFTRAYSKHLIGEVAAIADALPHAELALQWDVCQEVLMWEGYFEQPPGYKDEIIASLAATGDAVPADIELGYHLCYGSPLDEHCVQPKDLGVCVEMTTAILGAVRRRVQYVHLPVPHDRRDEDYVRPLGALMLPSGTDLYIGCVHADDATGNASRLAAAQRFARIAGVGTECGWGRGDPQRLDAILAAHRALIVS